MKPKSNRRYFLQKWGQLSLWVPLAGAGLALGCTKNSTPSRKKDKVSATNPCEDLTEVPAVDVEKRKSLGYTSLSPIPDKECRTCQLFIPPKEGAECGGCLLFAGPVAPEAYCTYWAPRV